MKIDRDKYIKYGIIAFPHTRISFIIDKRYELSRQYSINNIHIHFY